MPVIACKLGATQQVVGGATYSFNFDEKFGAHVAHVHNLTHAACFLSVEHYQEAGRGRKPEQGLENQAVRAESPNGERKKQEAKPVERQQEEPPKLERQRKSRIKPIEQDGSEA